ncbi:hypothetical protein GCM10023196_035470 [Actinoallomurus vinaceus]|uniref:DUF3618 domain-containing protein n=1 Tax=Actinoallomurus vinaceus TaxID=1080074 RepID=A0ABP8UBM1_9ACTN
MTNARSPDELGRLVDRHDVELREFRRDYITKELVLTMLGGLTDRVLRLEQDKASRRNALLAITGTLVGVLASAAITWLITTKGGGH